MSGCPYEHNQVGGRPFLLIDALRVVNSLAQAGSDSSIDLRYALRQSMPHGTPEWDVSKMERFALFAYHINAIHDEFYKPLISQAMEQLETGALDMSAGEFRIVIDANSRNQTIKLGRINEGQKIEEDRLKKYYYRTEDGDWQLAMFNQADGIFYTPEYSLISTSEDVIGRLQNNLFEAALRNYFASEHTPERQRLIDRMNELASEPYSRMDTFIEELVSNNMHFDYEDTLRLAARKSAILKIMQSFQGETLDYNQLFFKESGFESIDSRQEQIQRTLETTLETTEVDEAQFKYNINLVLDRLGLTLDESVITQAFNELRRLHSLADSVKDLQSEGDIIAWLHSNLEDVFRARLETFDFTDPKESIRSGFETIVSFMRNYLNAIRLREYAELTINDSYEIASIVSQGFERYGQLYEHDPDFNKEALEEIVRNILRAVLSDEEIDFFPARNPQSAQYNTVLHNILMPRVRQLATTLQAPYIDAGYTEVSKFAIMHLTSFAQQPPFPSLYHMVNGFYKVVQRSSGKRLMIQSDDSVHTDPLTRTVTCPALPTRVIRANYDNYIQLSEIFNRWEGSSYQRQEPE